MDSTRFAGSTSLCFPAEELCRPARGQYGTVGAVLKCPRYHHKKLQGSSGESQMVRSDDAFGPHSVSMGCLSCEP